MAQNPNSKRQQYVNNSMNNNNNNFNDNNNNFNNNMNNNNNMMGNNNNFNNNNNMGMNNNMGNNYQPQQQQQQQQQSSISCDQLGSTTDKTRQIIHKAINSVISGGQATNPESISVALRNAGFMALLFNGGHGFWWNFECEWSEWSFESNGRSESYRIIVWKPSQNK